MKNHYEAVIVGGGHNGLVAAFYLARGGLDTLVLEARPMVGGAAVTEEFSPGYMGAPGAYVVALLRDEVVADLRLSERGLVIDEVGDSFHIYDGNRHLWLRPDLEDSQREIARFSAADAEAYPDYIAHMNRLKGAVDPIFDLIPPDPGGGWRSGNMRALWRTGRHAFRFRRNLLDVAEVMTISAARFLDRYFESDELRAALSWHIVNDSQVGPMADGTAFIMLHEAVDDDGGAGALPWGFVRGGIGRVAEIMADAAREAGAEIRTDSPVAHIRIEGGRARGVELEDGAEITAGVVLSNADPIRTYLGLVGEAHLPPDFAAGLRTYRINGTSIKINLALSGLPLLSGYPNTQDEVQEYHRSLVEFHPTMEELEMGADNAKYGRPTLEKMNVELCFPTVHDPSLAPPGKHIMTIDANGQPYRLRDGTWDEISERVTEAVLDRIATRFPDLRSMILHREVLTPLDMERRMLLTGGHALHGDMSLDQLFSLRPRPYRGGYEGPVPALFLCGAGAHPGGGITGAPGHNCAIEVLRQRRGGRLRRLRSSRR